MPPARRGTLSNGSSTRQVLDPLQLADEDQSGHALSPHVVGTHVLDDIRRVSPDVHVHWADVADQLGNHEATDELLHLLHQVVEHSKSAPPVIQFVGVEGGEGASTIAALFANAAVDVGVGRVLLFSDFANEIENENVAAREGITFRSSDNELPRDESSPVCPEDVDSEPIDNRGLYICPMLSLMAERSGFQQNPLPDTAVVLDAMRSHFRLIIVDAGPALTEKNALRVCRSVDGVILVIESDKTSTARAQGAIKRIRGAGGHLLGAILNRKQPLLPRLFVGQL